MANRVALVGCDVMGGAIGTFPASAASSFVDGHTLYVDGGITACL